jgi:hypothetical protein
MFQKVDFNWKKQRIYVGQKNLILVTLVPIKKV